MTTRGNVLITSAVAAALLTACGNETASPTAPPEQPTIAAAAIGGGRAAGAQLACSAMVTYVFSEQNGTVISTEPYQTDFVVSPEADFVDDFSTPTRQKQFRASVARGSGEFVVTMSYFNDVGVFHSIDLTATLTVDKDGGTTSGANTFSTTVAGLNGHHRTDYSLTCQKA